MEESKIGLDKTSDFILETGISRPRSVGVSVQGYGRLWFWSHSFLIEMERNTFKHFSFILNLW